MWDRISLWIVDHVTIPIQALLLARQTLIEEVKPQITE